MQKLSQVLDVMLLIMSGINKNLSKLAHNSKKALKNQKFSFLLMSKMAALFLLAWVGVAVAQPANSNWPMYGGNALRTFTSYGDTPDRCGFRWRYPEHSNPLIGLSSPVVDANNNVYTVFGNVLTILNGNNGVLLTAFPFTSTDEGLSNGGALAIGMTGIIYIPVSNGEFKAFDASGVLQWSYQTSDSGFFDTPTIDHNNRVYVAADKLYVFDAETGDVIWTSTKYQYGSPTIYGEVGYSVENGLVAFALSNGQEKWSFWLQHQSAGYTQPIISNDRKSIAVAEFIGSYVYSLNLDTGTQIWNCSILGYPFGNVFVQVRNTFVIDANGLTAIYEDQTGGLCKIKWTATHPADYATIDANGNIYAGSRDHYHHIYLLDGNDGHVLWSYNTTEGYFDAPFAIASDGTVYATSSDGRLYAFGLDRDNTVRNIIIGVVCGVCGLLMMLGAYIYYTRYYRRSQPNPDAVRLLDNTV